MHQPDYRDPVQDEALLPWVFLHAVKDYGDMLQTALDFGAHVTFNLVPTLVEQLQGYASGTLRDRWLDLARRDPEGFGERERAVLVESFFSVYGERHIQPHARYRELAALRDRGGGPAWQRFSVQDLRDLQVWFLLAWAGHYLRRRPGVVADLLEKGRRFDEEDKQRLLQAYHQVVDGVLERYRQAEAAGAVELSMTPYAHPILPLLCDTGEAARARSGVVLPDTPFRFPEDARQQIRLGVRCGGDFFGEVPRGMWPSEGGLSETVVQLLAEEKVSWTAGDEALLDKSLPDGLRDRSRLYRPYSLAGVPLLFRDRPLSDRIGFVYAPWPPLDAADDLLRHLEEVARKVPGGLVTLILDGENCWERYEDNGYPFLKALYEGLAEHPALQAVTVNEALALQPAEPLARLAPGSWINGDFDIWIGHPEENRAWEWLGEARRTLQQADDRLWDAAWPHLLRAEGSDWFWWFGEHHQTDQAGIFDQLFRHHLQAFYHAVQRPQPGYLDYPVRAPHRRVRVSDPTAPVKPVIDGRVTDYFEWLGAGSIELTAGGTMHNASFDLLGCYFGYDENWFFMRFDFREPMEHLTGPAGELLLRVESGTAWLASLAAGSDRTLVRCLDEEGLSGVGPGASGAVVEMGLPLELLKPSPGDRLTLSWQLVAAGRELARWPLTGPLTVTYLGPSPEIWQWPL